MDLLRIKSLLDLKIFLERKLPKTQIIERKQQKSSSDKSQKTQQGSYFVTVATRSSDTSFRKFPSPPNQVFEEKTDEDIADNDDEYNKYSFFNNAQLVDPMNTAILLLIFFCSSLVF